MNPIVATESVNVFSADRVAGYAATAVLTLLGLVITVLILKKLLYKPILKVIHDRQSKVDALLQDAESRQAAIKSQTERLQEEADEAKTAAGALLKSAREQADAQREAILSDARREATAILAKADATGRRCWLRMRRGFTTRRSISRFRPWGILSCRGMHHRMPGAASGKCWPGLSPTSRPGGRREKHRIR